MSLKKIYYLLSVLLMGSTLLFVSCNKDDEEEELLGDWSEGSDFDGVPRSEAVCFLIGTNAYMATGVNIDLDRLRDLWVYNTEEGYWIQKADMPAGAKARSGAIAFSADNKGFVGTGVDDIGNKLKDFWSYNPTTNTWSEVTAIFPGTERYSAVAFSMNNKGYVGTGYDVNGETKDFYEYSPSSNTWAQIPYPGSKRKDASTFVIDNKAYLLGGTDNQVYDNELYVFDGVAKTWTKKRNITNSNADETYDDDYTSIARMAAVAFTVNGKGYFATGSNASSVSNVWEYNPATDLWIEKSQFEGSVRSEAVGFGIGNYGYVATGKSQGSYAFDDLVRFDPKANYDENY